MLIGYRCLFQTSFLTILLGLAACVTGPADDQGLTSAIRAHYAAHATEERGACRSPRIDTVQAHQTLETSANGEEVMLVRYSYYDRHADMDAAWDKLVHLSQPCGGIAERRFVLTKNALGYRVKAMSGERQDGESAR
jgi:hypothetical protein